ncbi:uncharacterized protein LOC133557731 [Nerophis ophidion]|uniref:uncharacterized protein LOC133557731 n=1 Tax=Nerophis ophidion TaxID=159077 RepID=UPI002ADFE8D0|nr:uncharacterized protein LOC133557731 [Nerophis ophidion]XP_061764455.1 uncharacterized protein LOC133557731 [Nerophis ophidion]
MRRCLKRLDELVTATDEDKTLQVTKPLLAQRHQERQNHLCCRRSANPSTGKPLHPKPREAIECGPVGQARRQGSTETTLRRPSEYQQEPAPRKVQVVVLQLHTLYPKGYVATEDVRDSILNSQRVGQINQLLHPKVTGPERCFSNNGLFGATLVHLPIQSIALGYKQEKARLILELEESSDPTVRNAHVPTPTGRKWQAGPEVAKAIGRLQHQEIVGRVQVGRAGLGWGDSPHLWSKATKMERRVMVMEEVSRGNQEQYTVKAVSQGRQGRWTTWEGTISRPTSWADLWKMPQARLSFLLGATYQSINQSMFIYIAPNHKCLKGLHKSL